MKKKSFGIWTKQLSVSHSFNHVCVLFHRRSVISTGLQKDLRDTSTSSWTPWLNTTCHSTSYESLKSQTPGWVQQTWAHDFGCAVFKTHSYNTLSLSLRMVSQGRSASFSSPIGQNKACQRQERALLISLAKSTKPRSSLDRMDRLLFTAGERQSERVCVCVCAW